MIVCGLPFRALGAALSIRTVWEDTPRSLPAEPHRVSIIITTCDENDRERRESVGELSLQINTRLFLYVDVQNQADRLLGFGECLKFAYGGE